MCIFKKCSRCRRKLSPDHFHRDRAKKDGRYTICKECRAGTTDLAAIPVGYWQCRTCDEIKPLCEFSPTNKGSKRHTCKDCCSILWNRPRPKPGRFPGHIRQSLLGYLSLGEQRAIARSNPEIHKRDKAAQCQYEQSEKGQRTRKRWREENKEYHQIKEQCRRAQKKSLVHDFTEDDWKATLEIFGYSCVYCHRNGIALEQDHWVPITKDGNYTAGNIVPACKHCNCSKRAMHPSNFCSREQYAEISGKLRTLSIRRGKSSECT